MASILVASLPYAGHVVALSAIAAELVRRGHDVVAYTGAKHHRSFTNAGATWLPWAKATDFDDADVAATFPKIGDGKGLRGGRANMDYVLIGTAAGQASDILAAGPFDLIVADQLAFGAGVAAQANGVSWATVGVTPLSMISRDLPAPAMPWLPATGPLGRARDAVVRSLAQVVGRAVFDPELNRLRARFGVGPVPPGRLLDSTYSTELVLAQGVPGLDYVRRDLPPHVNFVGRLASPRRPASAAELPPWWPDLAAARTVVHVTQGTVDTGPDDLLKPTIAALADQDVLVVCTTGGVPPAALGPLPANVRAAAFVPHDLLLPEVGVMVTNGGWGGVLAAIQAGVPLVVGGGSLDKPEVARRVSWSGAGVDLRSGAPEPARIARAVREVMSQPRFRTRARQLGEALSAAGGVPKAGDLLDRLLAH
jgi:MGT family glycosyltransferase